MKSAAGPYEFFHWKSSCGRLVVRTTWVKGIRHAVLSDDDADKHTPPSKKEREKKRRAHRGANENAAAVTAETATAVITTTITEDNGGPSNFAAKADDDYVERVLRWLHKPAGSMLETCRKPMSGGDNGSCCYSRRPALVNTCSIPDNKPERQQVVMINKRPTMMTRSANNIAAGNCTKNRHKTELHVHMPSVC